MNLSDLRLPQIDLSASQRETLEKYLPLMLVALVVWLAARGMRRMFWTAFGLFWAFGGWHGIQRFLH